VLLFVNVEIFHTHTPNKTQTIILFPHPFHIPMAHRCTSYIIPESTKEIGSFRVVPAMIF